MNAQVRDTRQTSKGFEVYGFDSRIVRYYALDGACNKRAERPYIAPVRSLEVEFM